MPATVNAPIILDLGKAKRKDIKQLKQSQGRLVSDVHDAMANVAASLGDAAEGKQLVPVVLLYSKKRRKGGRVAGGLFPFL